MSALTGLTRKKSSKSRLRLVSMNNLETDSLDSSLTRKKSRKNRARLGSMNDVETDSLDVTASTIAIGSLTKSVNEKSMGSREEEVTSYKTERSGHKNYLNLPQTLEEESDLGSITGALSRSDQLLEEILNSSVQKDLDSSEQPSFDVDRYRSLVPSDLSTSVLSSSTSSIWNLDDSFPMDVSPITTDDEESDPDRAIFSVAAKSNNKANDLNNNNTNIEAEPEIVLLSFTKNYYIEKNGLTEKTMVKLPMSSLQSMDTVSISPVRIVQLNFSRAPFDLGGRRFIFDKDDFEIIKKKMEPIIEQNQRWQTSSLLCKECELTFYGIRAQASGMRGGEKKCRSCGNRKSKQNSIYYMPVERFLTVAEIEELLKNSNRNDTSTPIKQTDKNSFSERIHNRGKSVISSETVCHRPATNLREAFEMFSPEANERKGISFEDSSNSLSLNKWVKKLLSCYTGYSWEWWNEVSWDSSEDLPSTNSKRISFSYSDFTDVDHRLKLYCELFLFPEREEMLQGLVKVIGSIGGKTPFLCIFAISTKKVYILRLTSEENESLKNWIKVEASCRLEEITSIYTVFHKQGVAVKLKDKLVFLCLFDSERANRLHCFILKCLDGIGSQLCIEDLISRSQSEHLQSYLRTHLNDFNSVVHLFEIVTLLRKNGECLNKFLIVTSKRILLFKADLKWLSSATSKPEFNDYSIFKLSSNFNFDLEDVDRIELYADNHFKIKFHEDEDNKSKPSWILHVTSPSVTSKIIEAMKLLYEKCHVIELEVKCYSENLTYLKETFKDTKFSSYVQSA